MGEPHLCRISAELALGQCHSLSCQATDVQGRMNGIIVYAATHGEQLPQDVRHKPYYSCSMQCVPGLGSFSSSKHRLSTQ